MKEKNFQISGLDATTRETAQRIWLCQCLHTIHLMQEDGFHLFGFITDLIFKAIVAALCIIAIFVAVIFFQESGTHAFFTQGFDYICRTVCVQLIFCLHPNFLSRIEQRTIASLILFDNYFLPATLHCCHFCTAAILPTFYRYIPYKNKPLSLNWALIFLQTASGKRLFDGRLLKFIIRLSAETFPGHGFHVSANNSWNSYYKPC